MTEQLDPISEQIPQNQPSPEVDTAAIAATGDVALQGVNPNLPENIRQLIAARRMGGPIRNGYTGDPVGNYVANRERILGNGK